MSISIFESNYSDNLYKIPTQPCHLTPTHFIYTATRHSTLSFLISVLAIMVELRHTQPGFFNRYIYAQMRLTVRLAKFKITNVATLAMFCLPDQVIRRTF
jgi:hypothetical protein